MPEKCSKCGELYDLSYDLEGNSEERQFGKARVLAGKKTGKAQLCWECRGK